MRNGFSRVVNQIMLPNGTRFVFGGTSSAIFDIASDMFSHLPALSIAALAISIICFFWSSESFSISSLTAFCASALNFTTMSRGTPRRRSGVCASRSLRRLRRMSFL